MGVLEVECLSYIYPRSSTPVLRGLSFDVAEGEIFGFLGPSGAGKSTTQRILIGIRRGYGGTVTVLGRDLMHWKADCRQQQDEGVTVFLTTHDMAVADALCTRVAFIVDGEIRVIDRPAALKRRYGKRAVRIEVAREPEANVHEFPLEGLADNADFLSLLRRADLQTVHTLETTLDEVFVQVTGRSLT